MVFFRHKKSEIDGVQSTSLAQAKLRLFLIACLMMLGYLAITLRLADLTLLRTKPVERIVADGDGIAIAPLDKPLRGTILDRNGELVATSLKMASVYADTTLIENPNAVAHELANILPDVPETELAKKLSSGRKFIWLARNITPRQEYAINALGHPGVSFQAEDRRIYPTKNLMAHVTGYTDLDGRGIAGIEKAYDAQLKDGEEPVRLTIDLRIQHLLQRELQKSMDKFSARAAIGMVMDVNTGEIISAVSLPDFDPYDAGRAKDEQKFNRCTLGVFEMGSTFKLFSTAAALDAGRVNFASEFDAGKPIKYGRFTISDYHAKNRAMTVPEIFMYSSNIGTARMAMTLGTNGLKDFYKKMGFFEPVPMNFPERGQPLYPKPWRDISTLTTSFGHGIAVSPLHLMRAASALVNGGYMVKPMIVLDDQQRAQNLKNRVLVIRPETSVMMRKLLELVVADGTGSNAYVEGYNVGGKTGTAEKTMGRRYNKGALFSSFLGFFPIDNPRYAVLAILDEPKGIKESYGYATGGWTGAPIVAKVIDQMGPLYQIPPDFDPARDINKTMGAYLKEPRKGKSLAIAGNGR